MTVYNCIVISSSGDCLSAVKECVPLTNGVLYKTKEQIIQSCKYAYLSLRGIDANSFRVAKYRGVDWLDNNSIYKAYREWVQDDIGVYFDEQGNEWHNNDFETLDIVPCSDFSDFKLRQKFSWKRLLEVLRFDEHVEDIIDGLFYTTEGHVKDLNLLAWCNPLCLFKSTKPDKLIVNGNCYDIKDIKEYKQLVAKLNPKDIATAVEWEIIEV